MENVNRLDLSIVILSFNSKTDLERLLPSVFSSQTKYSYEVIVVDNGSSDGTVAWLPTTNYPLLTIKNSNTGFASGNNLGIKQSLGKYVLLLNPDTKIEVDILEKMLDFMEQNSEVGISGCKVLKPDGTLDLACRRRFPNIANSFLRLSGISNRNYNYSNISINQSMEVDSVMGAFLLIRKSIIDKIGLLDESFFMYGEDLDWCWRCQEAGFKVWYFPETYITHYKGSSSRKTPFQALKWFHDAMWIFYSKHYAKNKPFFVNWLVWFAIKARLVILFVYNSFKADPVVSK